jgi:hypothetical protein
MKYVAQDATGFRVNQEGSLTYVYGRFRPDGSVVVSVYINKQLVFSETITPTHRRATRSTRGTADFLGDWA